MLDFSVKIFLLLGGGLFLLSAVVSLLLRSYKKACIIAATGLCMTAALFCGAGALQVLQNDTTAAEFSFSALSVPFAVVALQMDALSAFFVLCMSVLVFCVSLFSIGYTPRILSQRDAGVFYFLYSSFVLSLLLVLTAANTVFFYIAWEIMSVLSYFLVVWHSNKAENRSAATTYIIMTHLAAAFLLAAFLLLYRFTGSFSVFGDASMLPEGIRNTIFVFLLVGFGTKAGILPLHIWLPYAYPAAPGNVSALMSGIMTKTAVYGILRFVFSYLGIEQTWWGVLLLVLGLSSAVLGSAYAFVQTDIKRLLAYSSIDNIGIVFMGLGIAAISGVSGNHPASVVAMTAALLHAFNHTLFKGSLFLGAASVEVASKTRDMNRLGGLIKTMPHTSVLLLGGALSVAALVPFNGFVSEWMTYQAAFLAIVNGQEGLNTLFLLSVAGLAMTGALAVAAYVKLFGITCLGKPRSQEAADACEVALPMTLGTGLLTVMCLFTGLFPMAMVRIIRAVTDGLSKPLSVSSIEGARWYQPLGFHLSGSKIAPALMFFAMCAVVVVTAAVLLPAAKRRPIRRNVTWDCGYPKLTSAMQYSATGFSKPIVIVLRMVFRPVRKKTVTGEYLYHPEGIDYSTTSDSYIESTFYRPFYRTIRAAAERIRFSVQTGSVRRYLAYILLLLLVLMTYNRLM